MEGAPADMGDWGIKGVFHEAGRLLSKHLRDFLPTILVFIFPATLIKVLHAQFFVAAFVGPPGSSYFPEPTSFWLLILRSVLLGLILILPELLLPLAFTTMSLVLSDSIYISDLKAERHSQSLYTSVKLAFSAFREVQQTGGSSQERFRAPSKWEILKMLSAALLVGQLWVVISRSGVYFTPEAVTAMGLPLWTIFLITPFIVTVATVIISYALLVELVMFRWIRSPKTHIL